MFVPFGLRLQDDNTFVRQATGVNFLTPDDGIEFGIELAKWSAQVAVIEGDDGADDQISASAVYVQPKWRVGASVNTSEDAFGEREMQSVFGGLKTGPDLVARGAQRHHGRQRRPATATPTRRCSKAIGGCARGTT